MERMVSVRLRDAGQSFMYNAHDLDVKVNDYVIVEHDRGIDYGQVVSLGAGMPGPREGQRAQPPEQEESGATPAVQGDEPSRARMQRIQPPQEEATGRPRVQPADQRDGQGRAPAQVKRIVRIARESDLKQIEDNRARSKEAFVTCQKKIAEHRLEMKLVQSEYSFDRSKIIFYFTSGGRIDFRNLVKDLAKIFKARIELRQIGPRDETKFFGGFGPCGRELCCATFLKDFEPVTIKMAKEEGLPLNPPKISGICSRLMCCLNYEYETYKMLSKGLPREGERIVTAEGKGKVINLNVFKRTATVELEDGKFIEVNYNERPAAALPHACCGQERPDCCRQDKPERVPQRQDFRPRQEKPDRPGRQENRNDRGERQGGRAEQRGERQGRGWGRHEQRGERPERGRQERYNRHEQRGERPWQQRQGQNRPGQGQEKAQRQQP